MAVLPFNVTYDSALTLKNVGFSPALGAYVTAPEPFKNPPCITFISPLAEVTADGIFATLTFEVDEEVEVGSRLSIAVSTVDGNVYDESFNDDVSEVVNGAVNAS